MRRKKHRRTRRKEMGGARGWVCGRQRRAGDESRRQGKQIYMRKMGNERNQGERRRETWEKVEQEREENKQRKINSIK